MNNETVMVPAGSGAMSAERTALDFFRPQTSAHAIAPYSVDQAAQRLGAIRDFIERCMIDGIDYGTVPNVAKKFLHKSGAEKLTDFAGAMAVFQETNRIEQWDAGAPLFHYEFRAVLVDRKSGDPVAMGIGSANSMESKWRWRWANRICSACGAEAVIKGKEEYGGGWVCYRNKGGCGTKWKDNSPEASVYAEAQIGKVPNEDIFSQVNNIRKIAKKRALVDAALALTAAAAEFEADDEDDEDAPPRRPPQQAAKSTQAQQRQDRAEQKREAAKANETPPDGGHPNKVVINETVYWTAGVSREALIAVWNAAGQYDKKHGRGAHKAVIEGAFNYASTLDLKSDDEARAYVGRLAEAG